MVAAAAVLLVWNLYLTIGYENLKHQTTVNTQNTNTDDSGVIQNKIEGYTTDITETAQDVMPRLVCISAVNDQSEHIMSGIVYATIGTDTWILTASRWISDEAEYVVRFDNGLSSTAELYGYDSGSELALLLTHPEFEVEPIRLGASNALKQGEYVIALGGRNLHTQSGEVSFGVVAKPGQFYSGSASDGTEWITEGLVTDISLSDNLTGAPIVNLSGQMVGLLSSAMTEGKTYATAIGVNEVVLIAEELRNNREITRGYIGIIGEDVRNLELYQKSAMNIPLDISNGVVIEEVIDGSPAQEAGLQPNDVITNVNETSLNGMDSLRRQQYLHSPAETMNLTVVRGGNTTNVTVTLR